jgi:ketosteroid isomerase-like protein
MGKLQTFEALQQALARDDLEVMRAYLAEDFVLHEPPALPFGGDFLGPEGYVELVRQIKSFFELELLSSKLTEARDDLLLCELVIRFKSRRTGESAETDLVDLYHFDAQGKISRMDAFYMDPDTIAAVALGDPRPARPARAA